VAHLAPREERGLNSEQIVNLGVYCALTGMLGSKLMMIALDPDYRAHPENIFSIATLQSAGIFYGGFIGALVFAFFYMRRQNLPWKLTSDLFAPGVAIGHGIGRLGCFAAGCCWGKPARLPWAVSFTNPDAQSTGVPLGIPLHPTQLYEALAEAIICAILYWRLRKPHQDGQIIGLYLVLYGIVRFSVEFLREHDLSNPLGGPFVLEQWISIALIAGGLALSVRRTSRI
jgi:phosphatidylglycerol:prolipoprotein diacylglycerol transferase